MKTLLSILALSLLSISAADAQTPMTVLSITSGQAPTIGSACTVPYQLQRVQGTQTVYDCIGGLVTATGAAGSNVNCAGVSDSSALQAALNAGGHILVGPAGGTCLLTTPLVISSNTWLDLQPLTITSSTNIAQLIQNQASVAAQRTVSDGAMTALSHTLASATANFTSADIGRSVKVAGAAPYGTFLMTTITAVGSTTSVTTYDAAATTVSGASTSLFNRDLNVKITGGAWTLFAGDTYNMKFRHVDGLIVSDASYTSTTANPYAVSVEDATQTNIQRLVFTNIKADGVHFAGPLYNTYIADISGLSSAPTAVTITSIDWPGYDDSHGNVFDFVAERIKDSVSNTGTGLLVGIAGGMGTLIQRVTLRDLHTLTTTISPFSVTDNSPTGLGCTMGTSCSTSISGLLIDGVSGANVQFLLEPTLGADVTIRNVSVSQAATGGSGAFVFGALNQASYHNASWSSILIDGVYFSPNVTTSAVSVVSVGSGAIIGSLTLANFSGSFSQQNDVALSSGSTALTTFTGKNWSLARTSGTSNNPLIYITGSAAVGTISLSQIKLADTVASTYGEFVNIAASATVTDLRMNGVEVNGIVTGGSGTNFLHVYGTLGHYSLSDIQTSVITAVITSQSSTTVVGSGTVSNSFFATTNRFINASNTGGIDLTLNGVTITSTNAAIFTSGAPITIRGAGVSQGGGTWTGVTRGGSEVVHVINPDFPADITLLTGSVGDRCSNTNATYQLGPLISNGTNWYSMYNTLVH
jgi:hypothetical protein